MENGLLVSVEDVDDVHISIQAETGLIVSWHEDKYKVFCNAS